MERDDRLFAMIGGCVAAATAVTVWLSSTRPAEAPAKDRPLPSTVRMQANAQPTETPESGLQRAVMSPEVVRNAAVRTALQRVADHPRIASWLMNRDLADRAVAAIDRVAAGDVPRLALDFLASDRPFLVYEEDDRYLVAAGTGRRFGPVVDALLSVDVADAAAVFRELGPELEAAWMARGLDSDLEERVKAALDEVIDFEVPVGALEVERRARVYAWADDDLQALSPFRRAMLRMGADNARQLQRRASEFREALGWSVPDRLETPLMAELDGPATDHVDEETRIASSAPVVDPETDGGFQALTAP